MRGERVLPVGVGRGLHQLRERFADAVLGVVGSTISRWIWSRKLARVRNA